MNFKLYVETKTSHLRCHVLHVLYRYGGPPDDAGGGVVLSARGDQLSAPKPRQGPPHDPRKVQRGSPGNLRI